MAFVNCKTFTQSQEEQNQAIEALNKKMSEVGNYTAGDNISITSEKVINAIIPTHTASTQLQDMFGGNVGYIHKTVNGG